MSRARKVDANHAEIRELFRALGCSVFDSSGIAKFVDLVVQYRHPINGRVETYLVEIKNSALSPSRRALTPAQVKFHAEFQCYIVESEKCVIDLLGIYEP